MALNHIGPMRMWTAGVHAGLSSLWKEPVLGLKRLALPVSYWRTAEFAYVWKHLSCPPGAHILDLGSPKDLAMFLARQRGYRVSATDVLPEAIALSKRYARAQGLDGDRSGKVRSEVQDGRALSYPDDLFDAAFSVSVLEHIPDRGDSDAIRELIRVVKPGGVVIVTVPYDLEYRETFVDRAVYEREQVNGKPVFYERHYNDPTLKERLLSGNRAQLVDMELWGEGSVRMEKLMVRLGYARLFLSQIEPFLSAAFLRRITSRDAGHPMAAFFTLQKQ
jgi:SAM-dependent methyltransferase